MCSRKKIRTLFCMCVVVIVCVSSMIIIIVISADGADPVPFIPSPNRSMYRYYIIIILKRRPIGCSSGSTTLIYIIILYDYIPYTWRKGTRRKLLHTKRGGNLVDLGRPRKFFFWRYWFIFTFSPHRIQETRLGPVLVISCVLTIYYNHRIFLCLCACELTLFLLLLFCQGDRYIWCTTV